MDNAEKSGARCLEKMNWGSPFDEAGAGVQHRFLDHRESSNRATSAPVAQIGIWQGHRSPVVRLPRRRQAGLRRERSLAATRSVRQFFAGSRRHVVAANANDIAPGDFVS
jgi:hypothetical protein